MFLYSLLEVSEQATNIIKWISVGAVFLLLALLCLIGLLKNSTPDAKRIAFAGICIALSFTLAILKVSPIESGGSITLASFVPILIYSYCFGAAEGFIVGLIHGLLNFFEDPYILTPATFLFDYLLAFASVGVMGFFGKMKRKERGCKPLVLGCIAVFSIRFACHLISGMIFFLQAGALESFPNWATGSPFIYSFIYQCVYVPADAIIATLTLVALCKSGTFDKCIKIMKPL